MEIEIPNRANRLKPGMYAKVTLEIENRDNVLLVPKSALVDSQGQRGIYQPTDDNRAAFKPVTVGLEDNEKGEILDGLREGEIIISTGAGSLRPNDQLVVAGGNGDGPSNRGPAGPGGRRTPGGQGGRPNMNPGGGDGGGQRGSGQVPSGQEQPQRRPDAAARGNQQPIA
jgi:hypothetical protein